MKYIIALALYAIILSWAFDYNWVLAISLVAVMLLYAFDES
jgi:hypothetical protein